MSAKLENTPSTLPTVLAKYFASSKPKDPLLGHLNQIYAQMRPVDQLRCRATLFKIRQMQRTTREQAVIQPSVVPPADLKAG